MLALRPLILATITFATLPAQSPGDAVRLGLDQARAEFAAGVAARKQSLLAELEQAVAAATEPAAVDRLKKDLDALRDGDVLPASLPASAQRCEKANAEAADRLQKVCEQAARAFRDRAEQDSADRAVAEAAELRARSARRDLRCQVELGRDLLAGTWSWDGPALVKPEGERAILALSQKTKLPAAYALTFSVTRTAGQGDLQLVFPYQAGGRPAAAALVLGGWGGDLSGFQHVDGKTARENDTCHKNSALFSNEQRVTITLTVEPGEIAAAANGQSFASVSPEQRPSLPAGLAKEVRVPGVAYLIGSGTAAFRVDEVAFAAVPVRVEAVEARADRLDLLPRNAEWSATWEESGVRGGQCRSLVVDERDDGSAVLTIVTVNKAKFRLRLKTEGKRITSVEVEHLRTPTGTDTMAISECRGGGRIDEKGFWVEFTCKTVKRGTGTMRVKVVARREE